VQRQAPIRVRPAARQTLPPTFTNPARANLPDLNSPAPDHAQQIRGPPAEPKVGARRGRYRARNLGPGSSPGLHSARPRAVARGASWRFGQPGGHSEGPNTRSHPELGRENPQRRWYCVLRRGRAGRRQARQTPQADTGPARQNPPRTCAAGSQHDPNTPLPRGEAARDPRIRPVRPGDVRLITGRSLGRAREPLRRTPPPHPPAIRGPTEDTDAGWSSPVARQAHNWQEPWPSPRALKANATPAPASDPGAHRRHRRGVEQPGSSSGS
jgi:hypothetical protein